MAKTLQQYVVPQRAWYDRLSQSSDLTTCVPTDSKTSSKVQEKDSVLCQDTEVFFECRDYQEKREASLPDLPAEWFAALVNLAPSSHRSLMATLLSPPWRLCPHCLKKWSYHY